MTGTIRLYDGVTLQKVKEFSSTYSNPTFGQSVVYNPIRDELLVQDLTVQSANPKTLEVTEDLFPEILARECRTCYGQSFADAISLFPERNLLLVETGIPVAGGHGPGLDDPPHFFDISTLARLTNLAQLPGVEHSCYKATLTEPIEDHVYQGRHFFSYETLDNLLIYDLEGNQVTWIDGLALELTNPNTQQMYFPGDYSPWALDLTTLLPLGQFPAASCLFLDKERGRIYGFHGENLVILSQNGGRNEQKRPIPIAALPNSPIRLIQPSPDYAHDQTLFLVSDALYRSRDGGQSWAQLANSLSEYFVLSGGGLALSPDFSHDQILFTYYGERIYPPGAAGVYRSTDGGDTWQPVWQGLTHLRVNNLTLSSNYAVDGALLAYAKYHDLRAYGRTKFAGYSLFSSGNRGLTWTLVTTASDHSKLPSAAALLPMGTPEPLFRTNYGGSVKVMERSDDGGQSWQTLPLTITVSSSEQIILSPNFTADQTLYVLHSQGLFRSLDGGQTWQTWVDEWLLERNSTDKALTTMTISPSQDNNQPQLFIGTAAGEFRALNPAVMIWE